MNFFGTRVITDPSLFERVGLRLGPIATIGPKRFVDPPLKPDAIGTLDIILVTHAHMDHLDLPSLRSLPKSAVVVTCEKCSQLIAPLGFADVRELKWGEQTIVKGMTISGDRRAHWGKRWPWGQTYGYNSYVLEKNGHRVMLDATARRLACSRTSRRIRPTSRSFRSALTTVDLESRESRAGVVDVPADARALSAADSLGHVQVVERADEHADAKIDRGGRLRAEPNRAARNRRHLDAADRDRVARARRRV